MPYSPPSGRAPRRILRRLAARPVLVPVVLLVVGVAFSLGVAARFQSAARDRTEGEFRTAAAESTRAVRSELARSEDALRGAVGLFAASSGVGRTEFRTYVRSLDLSRRYPSMQGITYVSSVPADDLPRFVAEQRRDGAPGFAVKLAPDSDPRLVTRDQRRIVTFEETTAPGPPLNLGYDVSARVGARGAQDRARDTGKAAMTARLTVLPNPAPGFSLLVPAYRPGPPVRTVAERRAALRGWAIARFRGPEFLANIHRPLAADVRVELFDGDRADGRALLAAMPGSPEAGGMTSTIHLDAAGRTWTLRYTARPGFTSGYRQRAPLIALIGGLFLSIMTAALVRIHIVARRQADREVEERTAQLRDAARELTRVNLDLEARNREVEAHSREVEAFAVMQHEFVATASHELRTPLTSIIGYLELVLDAPPDQLAAQQRGHLKVVHRGGQRLLALVGDLLTVDKVDAGAMEIDPELERLDTLVAPAVEALRPAAERKGLTLAVEAGAEPLAVRVDGDRFEQVLGNVVGNAVKFTPADGEIRVTVARHGDTAEVRVADTGPGIPADELPRIFDRFYRASSSVRSATQGTGLGLTIARSLVEAHGGTLTAESEVGRGTTFVIALPLADPAAQAQAPAAGLAGVRDGARIA
jgi:signal transduction histidine kinase